MISNEINIFISSLGAGGAEKNSITLANMLVNNNFSVNFFVLKLHSFNTKKYLDNRINLFDLNVNHARYSFFAIFKNRRYLKNKKIVVFNHEISTMLVIIRYLCNIKFTIISRNISNLTQKKLYESSIWHKHIKDFFIRKFYKYVDILIAQSQDMKNDLIEQYNINSSKIRVINNPIGKKIEDENIKKLSTYKKRNEILFVGRIEAIKGLDLLIDAFLIVLKSEPSVRLRIIGDGSKKHQIKDYVDKHGLTKNVIFNGYQEDIVKYYKTAKVTVLSSLYEGFPNVLIESIALGTPIVAFNCKSGPSEIIVEGVNGFLSRNRDIDHLSKLIVQALHFNWDENKIIETSKKFNTEKIIQKYIEVIQE